VFRVPYSRGAPFLRNELYDMNVSILPSGTANGTFFISVVNPLQTQVASSSVTIMVWYRACENMQFRLPRSVLLNRFQTTPATNPFEVAVKYQGALGDGSDEAETEELLEFGNSGEYPADGMNFPGNGFSSVRALL
jgi:hypothetical protein